MSKSSSVHPREGGTGRSTRFSTTRPSWSGILSGSVIIAALLHAAVFQMWPEREVAGPLAGGERMISTLRLPAIAPIDLPAPPGPIRIPSPAAPTELALELPELLAGIEFPEIEEIWRIEVPPPPVVQQEDEWAGYLAFTPASVRPQIRNNPEVERFLQERYQPVFRSSGAQGVVEVRLWIDEEGIAQRALVALSSGLGVLDRLAMELSRVVRFRPAVSGGEIIPVQVVVPVQFRDGGLR
jgi:TonB family protein